MSSMDPLWSPAGTPTPPNPRARTRRAQSTHNIARTPPVRARIDATKIHPASTGRPSPLGLDTARTPPSGSASSSPAAAAPLLPSARPNANARQTPYSGPVRVVGMRRAASETPPSAQTSLGLGARVMTPAQAAHAHPLRHKSSKHFSAPVPQKTARVPNVGTQIYRATPPSMDAQHGERIARILSPPSPSTEVRRAASPQTSPTASSAGKDEAELDAWDAKHERKMLDLEISNKSLLSVNATLEATKIKQTKELKALRQQLVLNRLEADSDANGSPLLEENMFPGLFSMDMIRNDDGLPAQVMRAMSRQDVELNEVLSRCRVSIDALINEARAAMVSRPDAAGRTVLHPSEYEKEEHEDMHTQPHNSLEAALILL